MSRSVKSLQPCHPTLAMTNRLFWLMAIVLLILQLVDSLPPIDGKYGDSGDSGGWIDPSRDRPDVKHIPSDHRASSIFKFKTRNFEFSYETFQNTRPGGKADKDAINAAIEAIIKRLYDQGKPFPTGDRGGSSNLPNSGSVPPDCKLDIICNDNSAYPSEMVDEIMRNFVDLHKLVPNYESPTADRASAGDEQNLCISTDKRWGPTKVRMHLNAEWHLVANSNNFTQEMTVSHCMKADEDCSQQIGTARKHFKTSCQQQHIQRLMIVFEPDNMGGFKRIPIAKFFPVPSGCCCHAESLKVNQHVRRWSRSHRRGG